MFVSDKFLKFHCNIKIHFGDLDQLTMAWSLIKTWETEVPSRVLVNTM